MADQTLEQADDRLRIPELSRRARLQRFVLLGLALTGAVAAYFYFTRPQPVAELYRTDAVARRTIVRRIEATGSLDARSRVEVPAPIAGRLVEIRARAGERVERGQLLAELDERAAQLALQSAKASLQAASGRVAEAKAAFDAAEREHKRATRMLDKGLASEQDAQAAHGALERARAALQAARAERTLSSQNVASAKLGKSLGQIIAPTGGVLLRAPERLGAAVSPERGPLFVIGEPLDVMRVDAAVSETEIALIEPGQTAEIIVEALPEERFSARLKRIAIEPVQDSGVVQYPVTLLVDNPDGALRPGMSVRIELEVARAKDALSVHEAALRFVPPGLPEVPQDARTRLYRRVGPAELEEIAVRPGLSDGVYTQISVQGEARLESGDEVAMGLLRPEDASKKPRISLGKK